MPAKFTLQIDAKESPEGWLAQWSGDDGPIGGPFAVDGQAAKGMVELSDHFLKLFEQSGRPLIDPDALRQMGRTLFAKWFQPAPPAVTTNGHGLSTLRIQSVDRRVLNLPWELVELEGDRPVGCDAAWSVLRSPVSKSIEGPLRPGPLRILFLAAAPIDQQPLDYEREEDAMLRATARLPGVAVQFAELGSFSELTELVAECRPHVVHLSGHGRMGADGQGSFAFEDERGRTDSRGADDIVARVFRGSSVRCVFFNGCQTSQADAAGLCQSLVAAGVPLAVGWSASVADDRATDFTDEFYRRLVRAEPVPTAAAHARELIRVKGRTGQIQDATFAMLQVYSSASAGALFDDKAIPESYAGRRTEYVLLGDGIKGLREGFVGRRRERQRLIPSLRDGDTTFAVITGIGGAGKSTLATRAANRLEAVGFDVVPVRAEGTAGPVEAGRALLTRLIGALDDAFIKSGRDDLHRQLTDSHLTQSQRLRLAIKGLNELRLVLVIDNFEDVLELETRQIAEADLAQLYLLLATVVTRGSRVIITCRYLPEGTPVHLPAIQHVPLPDLDESNFRKFLRRDDAVDKRISRGELPASLIHELHRKLGGTPGFLESVRRVLRTADPNDLIEDLAGDTPGKLSEARASYYERIIATRLYDALPIDARDIVSRLAISELPLPIDAVTQIAGADETLARSSVDTAVAFGLLQRFDEPDLPSLYHPPGLLRPWLSDPARLPESVAVFVHKELAAFWRSSFETDREDELRVPIDVELWTCRSHADRGDDATTFSWSTVRIANMLDRRAEWIAARALLEEIPEQGRDSEHLMKLGRLEVLLGEWKAARIHIDRAHQLLPDGTSEKALAWHQLASIDLREGDYAAARRNFAKALEISQAIGDRAGEAATWHQLASIDLKEGDNAAARGNFAKALEIRQAIGDRAGEAATWHGLASIDLNQGDYAAARGNFAKALEIMQAIGDRAGEAATWHQLATIDILQGDNAAARGNFAKALEIKQAIGDRAGEAATWHQLASIDLKVGDYAAARGNFAKALEIQQAIGDRAGKAATWHQLATIDLNQGDYAAARGNFAKALEIRQAIGDRAGEAATWHGLATIDLDQGDYAAARGNFAKALEIRQAIGDRAGEAAAWHGLATIDLREGDYAAARGKFAKALEIRQAIGDRAGEAATWHQLASIDLDQGDYAAARGNFAKALEITQAIGDRAGEAATFYQLGFLAHNLGRGETGARLIGICFLIDHAIGHGDMESDLRSLSAVCSELGYNQAQFDAALNEAGDAYKNDRGQALIERAFSEGHQVRFAKPAKTQNHRAIIERLGALWKILTS